MIKRDYILRIIEEFFNALRRALSQAEEGQRDLALETLQKAYKSFLGAGVDFVDSQSADDLIASMRDGLLGPEQIAMTAKLLKEEADIREQLDQPDRAVACRQKALRLYLEVFCGPGAPRLESFFSEIERLVDQLSVDGIPLASARLLPLYWERDGRFDEAEDALFNAAEAAGPNDPLWGIGKALYGRLHSLSDEELEQGGLPRDEVEEGAREWHTREERCDDSGRPGV